MLILTTYCLTIVFLIFLSYLLYDSSMFQSHRIVNKHSIKKRIRIITSSKKSFLQISYEEKTNVSASRMTFLKQEWMKPQKEAEKKGFVRRNRMKQKTKEEKRKERRKREEKPTTIEGKKARRKTRTYNALFLVAARFKGKRTLLDISIRDEHATFG